MMRGRTHMAVAVRKPSGEIVVHQEPLTAAIYTKPWGQWPFVRGLGMLWDALGLGMRALLFSADVAMAEAGEEKVEFKGPLAWTTIAVSLAISVGIFFLVPSAIGRALHGVFPGHLANSLVEGLVRLVFFIAYIAAIGRLPDIRRVFAYHGAEHKTINAYEAGDSLEPDVVANYSISHVRCGTSFLLIVLIISILVFAPFNFQNIFLRLASRVLLIPVVAGIAYEFVRFSASHQSNSLIRLLVQPGLLLQRLTTREPDTSMLEVAIAALKPVLASDGIVVETRNVVAEELAPA
ncbi:MAG: DUF1385 domain-containing protein [Anaerolineae bacterium]|nr:DUF1385 domain-containing protein [Anaerolineae bacterium]